MEIILKKLDDLKPYENNPRNNDEAVEYVANSIQEFGFKVPIIIDNDNVIVTGHTRYKASKLLGLDEVPCIVADDLTEEQIKAFRIADNKVSEIAEWDKDLLAIEMDDIIEFDMSEFGFMDDENEEIEPINDEDIENTQRIENVLKFGKVQVVMTDDEFEELNQKFDDYVDENGVSFGFVRWLLNGR